MQKTEPYEIEEIEVGILKTEHVASVKMPRERFIKLVSELIDEGSYSDSVRNKLMPVAESMPRFPLTAWITEERGCGCVVGEYLVATSEIDRANLSRLIHQGTSNQITTVEKLLSQDPDGTELARFGGDIDEKVKQEIFSRGLDSMSFDTDMYDWESVTCYIQSVEIID